MDSPMAINELRDMVATRTWMVAASAGVLLGMAAAMFRGSLGRLLMGGTRDSQSLMNFSQLGSLRCICGANHPEELASDRRQFCRSCGCELVTADPALLEKQLTRAEIRKMTKSLRRAAIRASNMELPQGITSIDELHRYLEDAKPNSSRTPPTRPTTLGQPQVH